MSSPPEAAGGRRNRDEDLDWRVLVDGALPGAANMARDHALATELRPGTATVRFYRWEPATLSLGRNEPFSTGYRGFLRSRPEVGVVRRPTGGRAVLHDGELTYSVVLPARAFGGPRTVYRRVNEGLVDGLRRLGVDASSASGRSLPPDAGPCFLEPADGEVTIRDRKVVGSAQVRIGQAVLQHGSLLLLADQNSLFAGAGAVDAGGADPRPDIAGTENWNRNGNNGNDLAPELQSITLAEALGEIPSWTRLVKALSAGLAGSLGGFWAEGRMTEREVLRAADYEKRYGSREWTWRR